MYHVVFDLILSQTDSLVDSSELGNPDKSLKKGRAQCSLNAFLFFFLLFRSAKINRYTVRNELRPAFNIKPSCETVL